MSQEYSTDLSDAQWDRVRPFVEKSFGRPAQIERRRIVNAILYILRTGCQWRMLPCEFPHWSTVHSCYWRWRRDGTLERLHDALRQEVRLKAGVWHSPVLLSWTAKASRQRKKGAKRIRQSQKRERPQAAHFGGHVGPVNEGMRSSSQCARA